MKDAALLQTPDLEAARRMTRQPAGKEHLTALIPGPGIVLSDGVEKESGKWPGMVQNACAYVPHPQWQSEHESGLSSQCFDQNTHRKVRRSIGQHLLPYRREVAVCCNEEAGLHICMIRKLQTHAVRALADARKSMTKSDCSFGEGSVQFLHCKAVSSPSRRATMALITGAQGKPHIR